MEDKTIRTLTGYQIRENSGNLFKNNSDNPKAPQYTGLINCAGVGYQMALWKTEKGYLSIKLTEHKISENGKREEYKYNNSSSLTRTDMTPDEVSKVLADEMKATEKDEFNDDIPF